MTSRRNLLKMGVALSAVPLIGVLGEKLLRAGHFSTGLSDMDHAIGGGVAPGSFVAIVGPRGGGKTAFILNLARANGIVDAHTMNTGSSDMLSIMQRSDGSHVGSLLLDAAEPSSDQEKGDIDRDPGARDEFLTRWFKRSREVVRESGGLFVVSAWGTSSAPASASWMMFPDYIVHAGGSAYTVVKQPRA